MKKNTGFYMRLVHRYLGFFLAGIMAMYAVSGIIMIFRNTDFLKKEVQKEQKLPPNLSAEGLGPALRMRVQVEKTEGDVIYFNDGTYNTQTGMANYTKKELPYFLEKMEHLHKATTDSPVYWLNIFFGLSLLFFVISAFYMFMPKTTVFKKGLYFSLGGVLLTLLLLFV